MEITEYLDNSTWKCETVGKIQYCKKIFDCPAFNGHNNTEVAITVRNDYKGGCHVTIYHDFCPDGSKRPNYLFQGWLKNAAELEDIFGYIKLFEI